MPIRKVVDDYKEEVILNLDIINTRPNKPDYNAVYALCVIFQELTGDKCCMSCSRHLAKLVRYFKQHAKRFT